jgi:hypothetical protein
MNGSGGHHRVETVVDDGQRMILSIINQEKEPAARGGAAGGTYLFIPVFYNVA